MHYFTPVAVIAAVHAAVVLLASTGCPTDPIIDDVGEGEGEGEGESAGEGEGESAGEGEGEGESAGEGEGEGEGENPFCQHIDDVYWLVDCSGTFTEVRQFSPLPPLTPEECPVYFELNGVEGADRDAVVVEAGCDASCVRRQNTAGSYISCDGGRAGFDCYLDDEGSCGQMCRFPEGYYPSFEDYRTANPCPGQP